MSATHKTLIALTLTIYAFLLLLIRRSDRLQGFDMTK